jgi:hypothetical protein
MGLMRDGAGVIESIRHIIATQGPRALMTGTVSTTERYFLLEAERELCMEILC